MNNRERTLAALNYQPYDRLPVVHFGYWPETLEKWAAEGHITKTLAARWYHNNAYDRLLCERLGFDFGWGGVFGPNLGLQPAFRRRVMARLPDGSRHVLNRDGAIVLEKDDVVSIPAEIDHLLKGRAEWERIFKPRLRYTEDRLGRAKVHLPSGPLATREGEPLLPSLLAGEERRGAFRGRFWGSDSLAPQSTPPAPQSWGESPDNSQVPPRIGGLGGLIGVVATLASEKPTPVRGRGVRSLRFGRGGREYLLAEERAFPRGLWCGSLFGIIRNWLGVVGLSYLTADDPALLQEMVETVAELCYQGTAAALATGIAFDYGHFWEDICFKNGPLVNPRLFARLVGPHYRRITGLLNEHGVGIVSVDCDGMIDRLIPTWLENGVNTMFPIEVGTWGASIAPWRAQYGRALRGVGGMDKRVFACDYAAIDAEIERLRPLVDLGGYIPCPDHLIPPDAKWENVQYYCERMRKVFG